MKALLTTTIAVTAALLVVLGQILAMGHSMAERHEICEQHGEVIHAPDEPSLIASQDTLEALPPIEHDHGCGIVAGVTSAPDEPPRAAPPLLFELPDASPSPACPAAAPPPAPALSHAPKTSPPAMPTTV